MKLDLVTSHLYYLVFLSLSIFVCSSNVYLELKRGVPRIHLISLQSVFITPLYVCVFVMFFLYLLLYFYQFSLQFQYFYIQTEEMCSPGAVALIFPFVDERWKFNIDYWRIYWTCWMYLLNISKSLQVYLNVLNVLNIWMNEYWTY